MILQLFKVLFNVSTIFTVRPFASCISAYFWVNSTLPSSTIKLRWTSLELVTSYEPMACFNSTATSNTPTSPASQGTSRCQWNGACWMSSYWRWLFQPIMKDTSLRQKNSRLFQLGHGVDPAENNKQNCHRWYMYVNAFWCMVFFAKTDPNEKFWTHWGNHWNQCPLRWVLPKHPSEGIPWRLIKVPW